MLLDHACYHLDLFNAGYRQLLLFYVPMFLAGYAQDTDVYVFWGSWACLMLLLWEPYLSPPFPWISPDAAPDEADEAAAPADTAASHDPPQQDVKAGAPATKAACLQDTIHVHHDNSSSSSSTNHPCCQVLGGMEHGASSRPPAAVTTTTAAAESEAEHAAARERERKQRRQKQVDAWRWAVVSSVPGKQHGVYRLMHVLLIAPVVAVILGVRAQHSSCSKMAKMLAACPGGATLHYSSDLLAALLALYLLLVLSSCVLFVVFYAPCLKPQGSWQPADMLFFICKILGSALNTIVQSLVAGSFVSFMTTRAFWLCMSITGMSYVATDLLFDLEGEAPVGELWGPLGVLTSRLGNRQPGQARRGGSSRARHGSATSGLLLPTLSVCDNTSVVISPGALISRGAAAAGPDGPSKDTSNSAMAAAAARDDVASGGSASVASEDRAPFLVYRRPAGWRGFTIIALLVAVAAPCIVLLVKLVWQPESLLVADSGCEGQCYKRYVQLMYALCCMGLLSCYYSLTVGCIGMDPVEFVFVMSKHVLKKRR